MKCPYREQTRKYMVGLTEVTDEYFEDCYRAECPFWGEVYLICHKNRNPEPVKGCLRARQESGIK